MPIYQFGDLEPTIDPSAFVAAEATVIGDAVLAEDSSVWHGVVIRADNARITVGKGSNVQDGAVLHTDAGIPLVIGDNVTVGHQAMLHGCTIGEGSLIGIQAVVLNNAVIGRNCLVGARGARDESGAGPQGRGEREALRGAPAGIPKQAASPGLSSGSRWWSVNSCAKGPA